MTDFIIFLLSLYGILTTYHCHLLSKRIDLVHDRITLNNRRNGLDNGPWDEPEALATRAGRTQ